MKPNLDWAKIVGGQVIVLLFLAGGMVPFGLFPWVTQAQYEDLEAKHAELNQKYDMVITLKNQDNEWYRQLSEKVAAGMAGMGAKISNLEISVREMNQDIKQLLRERR